ncbi:alternative oxidase [Tricharina praecox]|uniref:alternative oxidase n=1 Tax=Tricharina praecox TaxID=43433 RepID=UPI00221E8061|nr:alternative oxidase [Tricharina praecox]KAI5846756.1 alternative oxidase [Tricharina praecox]
MLRTSTTRRPTCFVLTGTGKGISGSSKRTPDGYGAGAAANTTATATGTAVSVATSDWSLLYTFEEMEQIKIAHRKCSSWSDYVALTAVHVARWGFDLATGYKHDAAVALGKKDPAAAVQKYAMNESKWLTRVIFLESIAGVPGMVGGMVRHLHSLRLLKRDNGWIATLLEESQNERMHLLTFLKFREPGIFMRTMLLGAQGVFFNFFFLAYLISPRTCHRFVGYLEEEAVITYTRIIADLDAGKLPSWEGMEAPQIAKDYFKLPPGNDSVKDLLLVVRADEAKHREVNHTLANLEQKMDPNPYAAVWPAGVPTPSKGYQWIKGTGWEREELAKLAAEKPAAVVKV